LWVAGSTLRITSGQLTPDRREYNPAVDLGGFWYAAIFLAGLFVGSFFNVAIYRWPQEDPKEHEWVFNPSHCPRCGKRIRFYDNIPLVSWALLGGRCRDCKNPISIRYPLVELGTALLWVATAWATTHQGLARIDPPEINVWHIVFAIYFVSLFALTIIIDFETQLIPDEISIGVAAGAVLFLVATGMHGISGGWVSSLIGALPLTLLFFGFYLFGWMGLGDAKLSVGMGLLLGWPLIMAAGFLAVLTGGAVAIVFMLFLMALRKYEFGKIPIAFGPFLALGAILCIFWGWDLVRLYLGMFMPAARVIQVLPPGV
jgi:leader peptidase (prepilin peptidase)/N-methyltransferase